MIETTHNDSKQLKTLAISHYIVAGFAALFACIFIIHLIIGIVAIASPETFKDNSGNIPPPFFGWLFVILGGSALVMGLVFSVCLIFAGRFLARKQRYVFCLVIACLSCLFIPLGTILGIFTIYVLMRPSVKELFAHSQATSPAEKRYSA